MMSKAGMCARSRSRRAAAPETFRHASALFRPASSARGGGKKLNLAWHPNVEDMVKVCDVERAGCHEGVRGSSKVHILNCDPPPRSSSVPTTTGTRGPRPGLEPGDGRCLTSPRYQIVGSQPLSTSALRRPKRRRTVVLLEFSIDTRRMPCWFTRSLSSYVRDKRSRCRLFERPISNTRPSAARLCENALDVMISLTRLIGRLMPDFKTIADFRKSKGAAIRKRPQDPHRMLVANFVRPASCLRFSSAAAAASASRRWRNSSACRLPASTRSA